MFTGIITDLGKVTSVKKNGDTTFVIETSYDMDDVDIGASIACSGVCLTVTEKGNLGNGRGWFMVDASDETVSLTTAAHWKEGTMLNLERALRLGDELGGHLVLGHVDGVAHIVSRRPDGDSVRFQFEVPQELKRFIAPKGSVVINGVSLTVNEVEDTKFGVNIIPHTLQETTFGEAVLGDSVNIEVDALARYVARLMEHKD